MTKLLLLSLLYVFIVLVSYKLGEILWVEGLNYTFPLFTAILGGALASALFFDYITKKDS